jgi:hypothetical protein
LLAIRQNCEIWLLLASLLASLKVPGAAGDVPLLKIFPEFRESHPKRLYLPLHIFVLVFVHMFILTISLIFHLFLRLVFWPVMDTGKFASQRGSLSLIVSYHLRAMYLQCSRYRTMVSKLGTECRINEAILLLTPISSSFYLVRLICC